MDTVFPVDLVLRLRRSRLANRLIATVSEKPQLALTVFLSIVAGCILIGTILWARGYPGRDSGIFLYIAQVILEGKIPYRDAWDNKPPGIFYVNALGLFLGRGSVAGLWLVEFAALCGAVVLCVRALGRAFGLLAASFGSMTWLIGLMVLFTMEGTNLTEEYAIPFKFAALWLFLKCEEDGYGGWRGLAIGITGAFTLLFRQNLIGIHLAIVVYLLISRGYHRRPRRLLREWLCILLGAVAVLTPVSAYFAANSALDDLIDVAFLYNLLYSAAPMGDRLASVLTGFEVISGSGIGVLAVASWSAGLVFLMTGQQMQRDARRLLSLAVIAFPIEALLASASIRAHPHYYEAWLPVVAVLAGFFASYAIAGGHRPTTNGVRSHVMIWYVALVAGMAMMPTYATLQKARSLAGPAPVVDYAAGYVRDLTQPDNWVLIWGADLSINFVSQRRSPTRFVHQYPLFTRGYSTPEMVREFLADIEAHPPALIIDTSPVNSHIPPIDEGRRAVEGWKSWGPNGIYASSPDTDGILAYLNGNYRESATLVQRGKTVFVYERRNGAGQQ